MKTRRNKMIISEGAQETILESVRYVGCAVAFIAWIVVFIFSINLATQEYRFVIGAVYASVAMAACIYVEGKIYMMILSFLAEKCKYE